MRRPRTRLLLGLTATAAALDALTFLGLGRVFGSFQSGNVLFLGLGVGTENAPLSLRAAIVLAWFVAGAALGGRAGRGAERRVLELELALLAVFAGLWLIVGRPADHLVARDVLLALAGAAMGLQVVCALRLGVASVVTVAITATVAAAAERLGENARGARPAARRDAPSMALMGGVVGLYGVAGLTVALLPTARAVALAPLALLAATLAADRRPAPA